MNLMNIVSKFHTIQSHHVPQGRKSSIGQLPCFLVHIANIKFCTPCQYRQAITDENWKLTEKYLIQFLDTLSLKVL